MDGLSILNSYAYIWEGNGREGRRGGVVTTLWGEFMPSFVNRYLSLAETCHLSMNTCLFFVQILFGGMFIIGHGLVFVISPFVYGFLPADCWFASGPRLRDIQDWTGNDGGHR